MPEAEKPRRMSTHSLGVKCAVCLERLEADDCCGGHGSTFQQPSAWAARAWPEHPCFVSLPPAPTTPTATDDGAHGEGL